MPIVTLTSDWGVKDSYIAEMKGRIWSEDPNINIVDISHNVKKYDSWDAAFILMNAYRNFPNETIHILCVNSEASIQTPHIVVKYDNQYFIGADNGIFSLVFKEKPTEIIELDIHADSDIFTFPEKDVFAKVALHITKGKSIQELGNTKQGLNELTIAKPTFDNGIMRGQVIYIDSYENAIINITRSFFKQHIGKKKFVLRLRSGYEIDRIVEAYGDIVEGEKLALFGSTGFLEIAINKGNAASLLGINLFEPILIQVLEE